MKYAFLLLFVLLYGCNVNAGIAENIKQSDCEKDLGGKSPVVSACCRNAFSINPPKWAWNRAFEYCKVRFDKEKDKQELDRKQQERQDLEIINKTKQ